MSRPPVHRATPSPRHAGDRDRARYFGPGFAQLVDLAERLARERHGIEIPAKGRGLARTLLEIPALVAHILGEHQCLYAREAFLDTARLPDSLWRHARRLGSTPDTGVAATGLAAVTVTAGLSGTLPQGFALQSSPRGEVRAQTYETLAPAALDASFNAMRPADSEVPTPVVVADGVVELPLTRRHGLDRGDVVLLEGRAHAGVFQVQDPFEDVRPPRIRLRRVDGGPDDDTWPPGGDGYRLHARPQLRSRILGWNASAELYPPDRLAVPAAYADPTAGAEGSAGTVAYGYDLPADPSAPAATLGEELFLAQAVEGVDRGGPVAVLHSDRASVALVRGVADRTVLFRRGQRMRFPDPDATQPGATAVATSDQVVSSSTGGRVTALALADLVTGTPLAWTADRPFPLDAVVLAGFDRSLEVVARVPNPEPFDLTVALAVDLERIRPGRPVVLRHTGTGDALQAGITALLPPATEDGPWRVVLSLAGSSPPPGWTKGDVEVLGNVVRVSHGESTEATAYSSDGVTPYQSLALNRAPVTRVPGTRGPEPALQVRVDGVLWERVDDFAGVPAGARVYRTETGSDGTVTVHFGGGGRGAVPPAGVRNVTATYRVGLGTAGNVAPGRLARVRRSSPLVGAVTNPLPIGGGTDPAGVADVARQATRPVRTLHRAVSVSDHADLALLFPGVARAAARWLGRGAVELVVADAAGGPVADPAALRGFLDLRRDTGVPLVLLDPQPVPVVVAVRVERDPGWLVDAVRQDVEEVLIGEVPPGLFTFAARELSQPQALSDLYARLLALPSVTGVEATTFGLRTAGGGASGVADILHATDRQWLALSPADLDVTVAEPGRLVPDVTGSRGGPA